MEPAPASAAPPAPRALHALELASTLKAASSADLLATDVAALAKTLLAAQAVTRLGSQRALRKVWAESELRRALRDAAQKLKAARTAQARETKRQVAEAKLEAKQLHKAAAMAERAARKLAERLKKERSKLQKLGRMPKDEDLGD